jgi:hypothetical protein
MQAPYSEWWTKLLGPKGPSAVKPQPAKPNPMLGIGGSTKAFG